MDAVRTKLSEIEKQYKEIVEKLMDEKVMSDPKLLTKLSKEQARLTQPVDAYHQLLELDSRIAQADEMLKENDPELKEMARMEKDECEPEREATKKKKEQQQYIKWGCRKQTTYNRKCHTFC